MPRRTYQNKDIYGYIAGLKSIVATTRFSDITWGDNQRYLDRAQNDGTISSKIQCMYPCSHVIGSNIPMNTNVMVLEMNNTTNKLMGVGLIKNISPLFNKYQVYEIERYNTYTYLGGYHIPVGDLNEEETKLFSILESLCFRGYRHQKRLTGITCFPYDILYDYREEHGIDLVVELTKMFKVRFMKAE